jgi:hypothetical protein
MVTSPFVAPIQNSSTFVTSSFEDLQKLRVDAEACLWFAAANKPVDIVYAAELFVLLEEFVAAFL